MLSSIHRESTKSEYLCEVFKSVMLTGAQGSDEGSSFSSTVREQQAILIKIDSGDNIQSVAFLVDGKHIVGGGREGKIRCWRVEDGALTGTMNAGSHVWDIAVSGDGKWVVNGTTDGLVIVWSAASYEKVIAFAAHTSAAVGAVDVSPDGTRIATASDDKTACVWSLSTGQRLLGPLHHGDTVVAVKFSPDGGLIATVTWNYHRVQIFDGWYGHPLVDVEIRASPSINRSFAWTSDSKQLFVLSDDGNINCVDVPTGVTRSQWPIYGSHLNPKCIALVSDGTFLAASAYPSVSFWDTTTHEHIGGISMDTINVYSIAISANYVLAMADENTLTLRSLWDALPPSYFRPVSVFASKFRCM